MSILNSNVTPITQVYDGFDYRVHKDGACEFRSDNESIAVFKDFETFKEFADHANRMIEKVVLPPMRLHLTGCSRCRKYVQNRPGPGVCRQGPLLFKTVKENSVRIVKAMLVALEAADNEGKEKDA